MIAEHAERWKPAIVLHQLLGFCAFVLNHEKTDMSTKGQENERNKVSNNGFLLQTVPQALLNTEISQEGGSFKQTLLTSQVLQGCVKGVSRAFFHWLSCKPTSAGGSDLVWTVSP